MLYVITAKDIENSLDKRLEQRQAHRERLQKLYDNGKLLVAGPCPAVDSTDPGAAGYTGSLIIAEFESLGAAQDWADSDPYIANGTYESVDVKPFIQVFS